MKLVWSKSMNMFNFQNFLSLKGVDIHICNLFQIFNFDLNNFVNAHALLSKICYKQCSKFEKHQNSNSSRLIIEKIKYSFDEIQKLIYLHEWILVN